MESEITKDILSTRRNYFIEKVKTPLKEGLLAIGGVTKKRGNGIMDYLSLFWSIFKIVRSVYRYPEPTTTNTAKRNSHTMLKIFEHFFQLDRATPGYTLIFKAIRRLFIIEYEHDEHISDRVDILLMDLVQAYLDGQWEPPHLWSPMVYWNDSKAKEKLILAMDELANRVDNNSNEHEGAKEWLESQIVKSLVR